MGGVEDAVDAASQFIGPYLKKGKSEAAHNLLSDSQGVPDADQLLDQALSHLQRINAAELEQDPNAPYDASLVGIVYGLLDLVMSLGILPFLSPGVAYGQRPSSVLESSLSVPPLHNDDRLSHTLQILIPILEQEGVTGVHPLLAERTLPDLLAGTAELAFSPRSNERYHSMYEAQFEKIIKLTPIYRLLPLLTPWAEEDIPAWLKQRLKQNVAIIPLRHDGVRHTIEFISVAYLSKNSKMPHDTGNGLHSRTPISLEAMPHVAKLLVHPPAGMVHREWFGELAPQLWSLLDGASGVELSRAAAHIIIEFLLHRTTGAPGTIGWDLFVLPILRPLKPLNASATVRRDDTPANVLVDERDLRIALQRLSALAPAMTHPGPMRKLVGIPLLQLWGLLEYGRTRPSLDSFWTRTPRNILKKYMAVTCDPKQVDILTSNLVYNGDTFWHYAPGSFGGVELRLRTGDENEQHGMNGIFAKIGLLDEHVASFVSIIKDADVDDEHAGALFVSITKRWLSVNGAASASQQSLTQEPDIDPMAALANAKILEAMISALQQNFVRSPQHIIELMGQLLQNFVDGYRAKSGKSTDTTKPSRAVLRHIAKRKGSSEAEMATDAESEELTSFAISILSNLVSSADFKFKPNSELLSGIIPNLEYLSQNQTNPPLSSLITNASSNLLQFLRPSPVAPKEDDIQSKNRATLKSAITDLTSPEPPNRTWALSIIRKLIQDPATLPIIDIPSTTHLLLSASIADPETYVHLAAIPVLVQLATRAPNPTIRILVDAFVDVEEHSLRLTKEKDVQQALDFRLRVGEILNNLVLEDNFWIGAPSMGVRVSSLKMVLDATLAISSRRGQRKQTLSRRDLIAEEERKQQEEAEAAWGGPIPNLLDPEGENPGEQQERDALFKIVRGWENTGVEEDVRVRASALSILSVIMEKRLELLNQAAVDAGLQMVLQILAIETGGEKAILRRAAVLVVMGLLRGMDALLEQGKESAAGLTMRNTEEVERVIAWVKDEDGDELVQGHAENVLEGLETWKMKKLFKVDEGKLRLGANLGLEGRLRGLDVNPSLQSGEEGRRKLVVEELE